MRRLALITAALLVIVGGSAHAMRGERITVCTGNKVEEGSPDGCISNFSSRMSKRKVAFRIYCMEDPGTSCRAYVQLDTIRLHSRRERSRTIRFKNIVKSYSVPVGDRGTKVVFKLKRKTARRVRRARAADLGVSLYTRQPDGRVLCSGANDLSIRKPRPSAKHAAPFRPDESCGH